MKTSTTRRSLLALALGGALLAACGQQDPAPAPEVLASAADTVAGGGGAAELRAQRAEWQKTRGGRGYTFTTRFSCFCAGDVGKIAEVAVVGDRVTSVREAGTGRALNAEQFYTIEALFARAIEEAERGGHVEVAYHRAGYPARLVVGTLANDAGIAYEIHGATLD